MILHSLISVIRCFHITIPIGNAALLIPGFGQARALLEWHNISRFCGHCGEKTVPMEAGRRKQCSNESCKKRIYPRVDPVCYLLVWVLIDQLNDSVFCWRLWSIDLIQVVIMLVIDRENDRALLSKQSKFVPRMWSCLAGFIEVCSWPNLKPLHCLGTLTRIPTDWIILILKGKVIWFDLFGFRIFHPISLVYIWGAIK